MTIHSGIDHEIFYPRLGSCVELVKKYPELAHYHRPWLLYVGSELSRKNLSLIFQAIADLSAVFPGIRLLKVGPAGGEHFRKQTLEAIERQDVGNRVHLFEEVSNEDLVLFYNSADALLQPSRMEGFSFPVLEAMACGLPVVSSAAGSLPEISGEAAYLVPDLTVSGFARAIQEVLEVEDLRQKMISDGLIRAGGFRWEKSMNSLIEIYQKLDDNHNIPNY